MQLNAFPRSCFGEVSRAVGVLSGRPNSPWTNVWLNGLPTVAHAAQPCGRATSVPRPVMPRTLNPKSCGDSWKAGRLEGWKAGRLEALEFASAFGRKASGTSGPGLSQPFPQPAICTFRSRSEEQQSDATKTLKRTCWVVWNTP